MRVFSGFVSTMYILILLLMSFDGLFALECGETGTRPFLQGVLDGKVEVLKAAPNGTVSIKMNLDRRRSVKLFVCEVIAHNDEYDSDDDYESYGSSYSSSDEMETPSPSASAPNQGCPNSNFNLVQCGPPGISREECWAQGCCFDPTNQGFQCYPIAKTRRALKAELPECGTATMEIFNTTEILFMTMLPHKESLVYVEAIDVCGDHDPIKKTFSINTGEVEQCPPFDKEPPGSINSCYCADERFDEKNCPTCIIQRFSCEPGFVHDLVTDRCIFDTPECIFDEDAVIDRFEVQDPKVRLQHPELHPLYPNACVGPTWSPTARPSISPGESTHLPTNLPTNSPTESFCEIFDGNPGPITSQQPCQLPFQYKRGSTVLEFFYPPQVSHARPSGFTATGADEDSIWCPAEGQDNYDFFDSEGNKAWGFAHCSFESTIRPSFSPTEGPSSRAPTTFPSRNPTTINPTLNPTTPAPTSPPHGCVLNPEGPGWIIPENETFCNLPFIYRRSGIRDIEVWHPPAFGELKPWGLKGLGLSKRGNARIRWCIPLGIDVYNWDRWQRRKKWGTTECESEVPLRNATRNVPDCVAPCNVGFRFDPSLRRCVLIDEPICFKNHYFNSELCQTRECASNDDGMLSISGDVEKIESYNPAVFVVGVLTPTHFEDIENINFTFIGRESVFLMENDKFEFKFGVQKLIPGDKIMYQINATDKCGRSTSASRSFTVKNRAPVISVNTTFRNGETVVEHTVEENIHLIKLAKLGQIIAQLDASGSFDPDGFQLTFKWKFDGKVVSVGSSLNLTLTQYGLHEVLLDVEDMHEMVVRQIIEISIEPSVPPIARISINSNEKKWGAFSQVILDGSSSSDDVRILKYRWYVERMEEISFGGAIVSERAKRFLKSNGVLGFDGFNASRIPQFESPLSAKTMIDSLQRAKYTFGLEVTDNEGLADVALQNLTVLEDAHGAFSISTPTVWRRGAWEFFFVDDTNQNPEISFEFALIQRESGMRFKLKAMGDLLFVPLHIKTPASFSLEAHASYRGAILPFSAKSDWFTVRERFAFSVGEWSRCKSSAPCPANAEIKYGIQERVLTCVDLSLLEEASFESCISFVHERVPPTKQICRTFCGMSATRELWIPPWGSCCNDGPVIKREFICKNPETGEKFDFFDQDCKRLINSPPLIEASLVCPANNCSATSGVFKKEMDGKEFHLGVCACPSLKEVFSLCVLDHNKLPVKSSQCETSNAAFSGHKCIPNEVCGQNSWIVGPWGSCVGDCGSDSAISLRSVSCFDFLAGYFVDDKNCGRTTPKPRISRICNQGCPRYAWWVSSWDPCPETCEMGSTRVRDVRCISLQDEKVTVSDEHCSFTLKPKPLELCPCGFVSDWRDLEEICIRDQSGKCCESGEINSCGNCDGPELHIIDALGVCCASGSVDAAGVCCHSGIVDSCGVCSGTHLSCGQEVKVVNSNLRVNSAVEAEAQLHEIAATLEIPRDSILDFHVVQDKSSKSRNFNEISSETILLIQGAQDTWLRNLIESIGSNCNHTCSLGSRRGICGNGICEVGENCPEDCPLQFNDCIPNMKGTLCSGHGACLAGSSGECSCFQGFTGQRCEKCTPGWEKRIFKGKMTCVPFRDRPIATRYPSQSPTTIENLETLSPSDFPSRSQTSVPSVAFSREEEEQRDSFIRKWWPGILGGILSMLAFGVCGFAVCLWFLYGPTIGGNFRRKIGRRRVNPCEVSRRTNSVKGTLKMRTDSKFPWERLFFVLENNELRWFAGATESEKNEEIYFIGEMDHLSLNEIAETHSFRSQGQFEFKIKLHNENVMHFKCSSENECITWVEALSCNIRFDSEQEPPLPPS